MRAVIRPGRAAGEVTVPGSKSVAHRLLIAAALSGSVTDILSCPDNEDVSATADCLEALGARVVRDSETAKVTVAGIPSEKTDKGLRVLPCHESGSTLRFLLPLALSDGVPTRMTGSPRLLERPLSVYEDICRQNGFLWERTADTLTVCGRLRAGEYVIPGGISSQFVTGLLFALPLLGSDSVVRLSSAPESAPYIDLSLDVLSTCGVRIDRPYERTFIIHGGQRFAAPPVVRVPGDESAAAFFGAMNALGGHVTLTGLDPASRQGDRVYRELFDACRAGCPTVSVRDCPDLAPILMVVGACLYGVRLTGTSRLKYKESDRGAVMAQELRKCGVTVTVTSDTITVPGGQIAVPSVPLDGHGDHRAAMALGVLCTVTGGEIDGAEAVSKSLPSFWEMIKSLGIDVTLV